MSIMAARPGAGGYRRLTAGPVAVAHTSRTDLAAEPGRLGEPLVTIAHLSDLHVCDAQSPARVEYIDRWADPDSPVLDLIGEVGTYRAHEMLTTHVAAAMLAAVDAIEAAPVGGARPDLALLTGDNIDNAQANELEWYLTLLAGGEVRADSGAADRWEGVAGADWVDARYWHPDVRSGDLPQRRFGFPYLPGLLDAARHPFPAPGLALPWLAVHGNHDRLFQGTWAGTFDPAAAVKHVGFTTTPAPQQILGLMRGLASCDDAALRRLDAMPTRVVTADPRRGRITRQQFVAAHLRHGDHGFTDPDLAWYRRDVTDGLTLLVLDTVDEHGGWEGSLDPEQFVWLGDELADADRERRYVVLASHHPLANLVNTRTDGPQRMLAADVARLLARHRCVVLWLNGHTHATAVRPHGTWWEVTAPSLIDWPQQSRLVELMRAGDTLTVAVTELDHAGTTAYGDVPQTASALAGLSRELAANDWQWRATGLETHPRAGAPADRNVLLHLPDPWHAAATARPAARWPG